MVLKFSTKERLRNFKAPMSFTNSDSILLCTYYIHVLVYLLSIEHDHHSRAPSHHENTAKHSLPMAVPFWEENMLLGMISNLINMRYSPIPDIIKIFQDKDLGSCMVTWFCCLYHIYCVHISIRIDDTTQLNITYVTVWTKTSLVHTSNFTTLIIHKNVSVCHTELKLSAVMQLFLLY